MTINVDLCCGKYKPEGYVGVDIFPQEGVDIVADLNGRYPFEDNSVDSVRAHDAIEHMVDKIHTMNEIWRICKNGALVDIFVPSTDGRGAFQDPTHVSYWNVNSFSYYSSAHPSLWGLCKTYGFNGNFKIISIGEQGMEPKILFVKTILEVVK